METALNKLVPPVINMCITLWRYLCDVFACERENVCVHVNWQ